MLRKDDLKDKITRLLNQSKIDDAKAWVIFNEMQFNTNLSPADQEDLISIKNSSQLNLLRCIMRQDKDKANAVLEYYLNLKKNHNSKLVLSPDCLNILFEKNYYDLLYLSVMNQLVTPSHYSEIAKHAQGLFNYILSLAQQEQQQAFQSMSNPNHVLGIIFKDKKEILDNAKLRVAALVPQSSVATVPQISPPRLYPTLQEIEYSPASTPSYYVPYYITPAPSASSAPSAPYFTVQQFYQVAPPGSVLYNPNAVQAPTPQLSTTPTLVPTYKPTNGN